MTDKTTTVWTVTGYHVRDGRYCRCDESTRKRAEQFAAQYLKPGFRLFRVVITEIKTSDPS